MVKSVFWFMYS